MRQALYRVLSVLGMITSVATGYLFVCALFAHGSEQFLYYRFALLSTLIVTICIETRVRMGYRLKRDVLFATHLTTAIPFFVLLIGLAFITLPLWVVWLEGVCGGVALITGIVLFIQGLRKHW